MSFSLAALGGILIGLSSLIVLLVSGKVAGVSGLANAFVDGPIDWRAGFIGGLVFAGIALPFLVPASFPDVAASHTELIIGGVLVGFGTRFGNGCTSGHGVCGIARVSKRSVLATCVFMATAIGTVWTMGVWQ